MFSFVILFLALISYTSATCTPPVGTTSVYDVCATTSAETIVTELRSTDMGSGSFSVGDLLGKVAVVAGLPFYDGGISPTLQHITTPEALTVDVKLSSGATTLYTADIAQLLAGALYARAEDGIYPNIQDPFLARETELDNVVGLLTEISYHLDTISTQGRTFFCTQYDDFGVCINSLTLTVSEMLKLALFGQEVSFVQHYDHAPFRTHIQYVPLVNTAFTGYLHPSNMVTNGGGTHESDKCPLPAGSLNVYYPQFPYSASTLPADLTISSDEVYETLQPDYNTLLPVVSFSRCNVPFGDSEVNSRMNTAATTGGGNDLRVQVFT